jgi:diguanylate cyclase (GGDEF)-like protein/PAS domain S-box-containing protein
LDADRHENPSGSPGPADAAAASVSWSAGARAPRPDDAPAARWRRGALAAYYLAFLIANLIMLSGPARIVLTVLAGSTVLLLATAALRGTRSGRGWERLAYLLVLDSVAQVAVTGQLHYTIALILTLVGVGGAAPARRTAVLAGLTGIIGWTGAVLAEPSLRTGELGYYAVQLGMAALLGAILHEATRRRQRELQDARDQVTMVLARFQSLFQASPAGVGITDERGVFVAINPSFCDLVGKPAEELIGTSSQAYVDPAADLDPAGRQMRYVLPDGSVRWVWLTVGRTDSQHWMLIHLHDVTDRHLAERAVRESDRLLAAVSVAARRIRTGEDARGTIIQAVRELAEADSVSLLESDGDALVVTGWVGAEVMGTRVAKNGSSMIANVYRDAQPVFLADPAEDPKVSPALLELVGARSMMWQPVIADGKVVALLAVGWKQRVSSVSDLRARAVALLADETALALEHERLLSRLEQMAYTDTLTGLSNRRAWQSRFADLLLGSRVEGRPLTVAIADLDRFKHYNDTHGHLAGDDLLTATANAFRGQLREGDLIARWGGEEFVVALPDCDDAEAAGILDRLRASTPGAETCSVGYAVWNGSEPAERLLERADAALYEAKAAGRDTVRGAAAVTVGN